MHLSLGVISATCALLVATGSAFAGTPATPGPVPAVGAPALLIIGGAFMAIRHFRSRK